jgi:hypothetical protein
MAFKALIFTEIMTAQQHYAGICTEYYLKSGKKCVKYGYKLTYAPE